MPLGLQAVLPIAILLIAAAVVRLRSRQASNGWIALAATSLAALITLVELVRLSSGEHVDVPYLTTFPYGDLLIRLDGLSLAFATVTLITAALLMVVRRRDRRDRRDPWMGWLVTSAAACALILAGNLVLLYILLQLLTLAWSGALNETAPRRRRLRLTLQIADIGLLLAAASAIQSVGTSSFSGVPSDTFGVPSFALMLLPVVVRIGALAAAARRPMAAVIFGPAIAWMAPAAYMLMRLLALMGGRLPDRPTAVVMFAAGAIGALALALAAWWMPRARTGFLLLAAQACLAFALSSGADSLLTVACTWLWLLLIPLAGLVSLRTEASSAAEALTKFQLSMLPGSIAFGAIWLSALQLNARGLLFAVIPIGLGVLAATIAALRRLTLPRAISLDPAVVWGAGLLIVAALPVLIVNELVMPAAETVRLVPSSTVSAGPLGLSTPLGAWPALPVSLVVLAALVITTRSRREVRLEPWIPAMDYRSPAPGWLPSWRPAMAAPRGWWPRATLFGAFGMVLLIALLRP